MLQHSGDVGEYAADKFFRHSGLDHLYLERHYDGNRVAGLDN